MIALARQAEAAGKETFWCLDEPPDGDAFVVQAVVARQTSRIAVGVAGIDCRLRHPVLALGAALTLDELSSGRAMLAFASGELAEEGLAAARAAVQHTTFEGPHFVLDHGSYVWGRHDLLVLIPPSQVTIPSDPTQAAELLAR